MPGPSAAPPALEVEKLDKSFGAHQVLKQVDLVVAPGERVVVCGPSGSGKSTLIRCVNGIEPFDRGNVRVDGVELTRDPAVIAEVRRHVGMVFQSFNLFPHLTALQNCMLAPMHEQGMERAAAEANARDYLAKVRLADHAHKYPAQLSGGQQQRVAIARALCLRPRLMLFDEPTSALDPEMVREVLDVMVALAREGMTMICVTHEMGFARQVADRIVFMDDGRILDARPTAEFFDSRAHERTQRFLSSLQR